MFLLLLVLLPVCVVSQQLQTSIHPSSRLTVTQTEQFTDSWGAGTRTRSNNFYTPMNNVYYQQGDGPQRLGYKYVWDSSQNRWRLAAEYNCDGQMVDYVYGTPRFYCNCGQFGVFYQVGGCTPNIPDPRRG